MNEEEHWPIRDEAAAMEEITKQLSAVHGFLKQQAFQDDVVQVQAALHSAVLMLNVGLSNVLNRVTFITSKILNHLGAGLQQIWGQMIRALNNIAVKIESWTIQGGIKIGTSPDTSFSISITYKP